MIRSVTLPDAYRSAHPYLNNLPGLARSTWVFGTGMTVIVGSNGSGKSTLLRLIAERLYAAQGGQSVVTKDALGDRHQAKDAVIHVEHDGTGVWHCDPEHTVGMYHGAIDWDFGMKGIDAAVTHNYSSGQKRLAAIKDIVTALAGEKSPGIKVQVPVEYLRRALDEETYLKGTLPVGQPTFLLDEPERALDADNQLALWRGLLSKSQTCQILVATHSPFPLIALHPTRILELEPGAVHRILDETANTLAISSIVGRTLGPASTAVPNEPNPLSAVQEETLRVVLRGMEKDQPPSPPPNTTHAD